MRSKNCTVFWGFADSEHAVSIRICMLPIPLIGHRALFAKLGLGEARGHAHGRLLILLPLAASGCDGEAPRGPRFLPQAAGHCNWSALREMRWAMSCV